MRTKTLFTLSLCLLALSGCSTPPKDTPTNAAESFQSAKKALINGDYESARTQFEQLQATFPYGPYAEQAYLEKAYAHFRFEEYDAAIFEYTRFLREYVRHPNAPYAMYMLGLSAESKVRNFLDAYFTDPADRDAGSLKAAYQYYAQLINTHPTSAYAVDAQKRMVRITNALARHEYKVGVYYFERKNYLSSVNRIKFLIENYPTSQAVLPGLVLMQQAYLRLNMPELAAATQKVIELNRPAQSAQAPE
jgi:outer membrane protein assembly factor BamD